MSTPPVSVRLLPGWTNSGPGHWQSLWQRRHADWQRIEQRDFDHPVPDEWIDAVVRDIEAAPGPVVLAAHSLGVITVVHAAPRLARRVAGALLVTLADVEDPEVVPELRGFAPIPRARLPFASRLVASRDDTWCTFARAQEFAAAWGSTLVDAGFADHMHTAAGYGPWPEGEAMMLELIAEAQAAQA